MRHRRGEQWRTCPLSHEHSDDPVSDSGCPPNDERPPICPVCDVTMVPAGLSAWGAHDGDWVCVECEETAEPDEV